MSSTVCPDGLVPHSWRDGECIRCGAEQPKTLSSNPVGVSHEFRNGPIRAYATDGFVRIEANDVETGDDAEVYLDASEARALHLWLGRALSAHETPAPHWLSADLAELRENLRDTIGNDYARVVEDIERRLAAGRPDSFVLLVRELRALRDAGQSITLTPAQIDAVIERMGGYAVPLAASPEKADTSCECHFDEQSNTCTWIGCPNNSPGSPTHCPLPWPRAQKACASRETTVGPGPMPIQIPAPCWCPYCGEPHSPAISETNPRTAEKTEAGQGRPVRPHRSGGGSLPSPEPPIEPRCTFCGGLLNRPAPNHCPVRETHAQPEKLNEQT